MSDKGKKSKVPSKMTEAGENFGAEFGRLTSFTLFILELAKASDETAKIIARTLQKHQLGKYELGKYKDRDVIQEIEDKGAVKGLLDFHRHTFFEIILCRGVDNFLSYVTQLLALIFRNKPEMLRSSERIKLDYILEHQSMEDLIHDLVERKVNDLSYQGMRKLNTSLAEQIGFQLIPDGQELDETVRIIESRNLIVHNRGIVNELYLMRVPNSNESLGKKLNLESDSIFDDLEFLSKKVISIDVNAAKKFSLPLVKMK